VRRLTQFQRIEGKSPLGLLIEGSFDETIEKLKKLIEKEKPPMIISVGDAVSESLIKRDVFPNVFIIDSKVMRKIVASFSAKVDETRHVKNPPGTLNEEALKEVQEVLKKKQKRIKIVVDGEEDLLTLPAVLYAPENSLVVYGQPRRGIVAVKVTKQKKEKVRQIIEEMEQSL
jgi:uncharacterized protein (UPF0218 family)